MLTWLESLAGAVWPVRCAGCGRPDAVLCRDCRAWRGPPRQLGPPGLDVPVWAVSAYGGPAADLISQWKERGRHDLTGYLASGLADAVAACLASTAVASSAVASSAVASTAGAASSGSGPGFESAVLVPVPSSGAARRRRGSNLVADLAATAARELPGVACAPALRLRRQVHDQAGLDVAGRRANLDGAFSAFGAFGVGARLAGRVVVPVDDVVTTGATLAEAVRALRQEGAHVVGACCLSVTLRRHGVPIRRGLD